MFSRDKELFKKIRQLNWRLKRFERDLLAARSKNNRLQKKFMKLEARMRNLVWNCATLFKKNDNKYD